jgi:transcriptional regulator of acetoin/glycerol metabolism
VALLIRSILSTPFDEATWPALPSQRNLAAVEQAHIVQTLERCGWNHSRAADALGIARTTLWRKLKDYGLDRSEIRDR